MLEVPPSWVRKLEPLTVLAPVAWVVCPLAQGLQRAWAPLHAAALLFRLRKKEKKRLRLSTLKSPRVEVYWPSPCPKSDKQVFVT